MANIMKEEVFLASPNPFDENSNEEDYLKLLEHVIATAKRKNGKIPAKSSTDIVGLLKSLPEEAPQSPCSPTSGFHWRTEEEIELDRQIGAAGELYAFEILKGLGLPGFGLENWQSNIRPRVSIHPSYAGVEAWHGAESADITYEDSSGAFTNLLMHNGYLDSVVWKDQTPRYFFEVKTTTMECDTTFFLGRGQYERMQRMKLGDRDASEEVYCILRVFKIDSIDLDMKIYVDPAGMRDMAMK
ncbi:hypothetical protein BGZ60DRAFT_532903 [Tricladium varicosporioides]|nr:hypothetical protein BGZ60DRAFT_532903 [Hymenoscyphus varicosporioides]